jgi:hypothetical protein
MPRALQTQARSVCATSSRRAPRARKRAAQSWTHLSDEELLSLRFCDLGLKLERTPLQKHVKRLHAELESRGIEFMPHVWLAEEFFSPDGVPGIAVPFYLAHPRLEKLERRIMREVEGGNTRSLMRILRHEAGHALDNAYRLRRKRKWREVFGPASAPYPHRYRARPGSRRYVHHLGQWYAQSHPAEDFAETFAVWVKPKSDWRKSYAGWPAFNKLSLVDELMTSVRGTRAPVRNRLRIEPIDEDKRTLAHYYRRKLRRYRMYRRGLADDLIQRIFSPEPARANSVKAATLLRSAAKTLEASVARELGMERYSVHQILRMLIDRVDNLKLYVRGNRRDALSHSRWMLARLSRLYSQCETPHLAL